MHPKTEIALWLKRTLFPEDLYRCSHEFTEYEFMLHECWASRRRVCLKCGKQEIEENS